MEDINEECKRMELKKMLMNYDLKYHNVAEPGEAEVSKHSSTMSLHARKCCLKNKA